MTQQFLKLRLKRWYAYSSLLSPTMELSMMNLLRTTQKFLCSTAR